MPASETALGSRPGAAFDLPTVLRFADAAVTALGAAREEIDALNVYPVPDGDTGTNLYLTFEAARAAMLDALEDLPDPGDQARDGSDPDALAIAMAAFARGALLGARGNSGVIVSQLVGALCRQVAAADPGERPAVVLAEAMGRATEAAYAAVGRPVEGTVLSVARAASDAALRTASVPAFQMGHVVRAAAEAARAALARTPDQLSLLREAGVVDAGGRGLCVVLDAAESAVTGRRRVSAHPPLGTHAIPVPLPALHPTPEGPAFEVMFLLDADDAAVPALQTALGELGDAVVVVGGEGLWHVHAHVDDVGAALEAGLTAGRPHRVRVTHFAEQATRSAAARSPTAAATTAHSSVTGCDPRSAAERPPSADAPPSQRSVVALAAGASLGDLFAKAGAVVVPTGPGQRPSTGQVLDAIGRAAAAEVIVLPNDPDAIAVAEAAARAAREADGVRVTVIPTQAQVQGLAALAVHEPGRTFEEDLVGMSAAARHARSGTLTVAARRAMTMAGPCEPGDVLGAIEGDFVLVGSDLVDVATGVLDRLLGGGGELVTLVGTPELTGRCAAYLERTHPSVDVVVYEGDQQPHPLLVGVE